MGFCREHKKDMKPGNRAYKAETGFTLVEIMIAVFIFSAGLLAVASMQVSGTQGTTSARWNTDATAWASDRIEKILSLPYDHPDLTNGANGPVIEDQYTIAWTVAQDDLIDNTKTITVTVSWLDRGLTRNTSFTYYKADI
ncbi:MAG: prepilin-type N-terminal cleavage/methylation domain-containing protein [Deltaproteobacteria bacterium]|nr:prepilin-type N-terminal cleavage/methylation domain-containing protein [Deltaproteobacteria bacterium]